MNTHQVMLLTLQGSVLLVVFSFGLQASGSDLMYLLRRPGSLARSLLAMFVIMPVLAVTLAFSFNFKPPVEIALVALALSPVPPLLPRREMKAGAQAGHALGLLAIAALSSIVIIPAALHILRGFVTQPLGMPFSRIALLASISVLLPLIAGLMLHGAAPRLATRLARPIGIFGSILLLAGASALLVQSHQVVTQLLGDGTVVAIVLFVVAGLLVGHVLGGPVPEERTVLALSTACRHPAIALALGTANYPEQRSIPAAILLYLIVSIVVSLPYVARRRRGHVQASAAQPDAPRSKEQRPAA